jgi:hypothetical protein
VGASGVDRLTANAGVRPDSVRATAIELHHILGSCGDRDGLGSLNMLWRGRATMHEHRVRRRGKLTEWLMRSRP